MSRTRPLRVELLVADFISSQCPGAPNSLALSAEGGTLAGEAVALAVFARFAVLAMGVRGAGAGLPGAGFLEVTFVSCVTAGQTSGFELEEMVW